MPFFVSVPAVRVRALVAVLGLGLLTACATSTPSASAAAGSAPATPVPAALQVTETERVAFTWHAIGALVYECRSNDKGLYAWAFVVPEAELFNSNDEKVGTHGAGPSWSGLDGSKAVGTVKAKTAGQRPTDIPWLLLSTKSVGVAGKMASITSVQRINTEGGNAPQKGCEAEADAGKRVKEGYTSDYVFFVQK